MGDLGGLGNLGSLGGLVSICQIVCLSVTIFGTEDANT